MITVYITGVFDILHKGHLRALKRAKCLGDFLVVGIQDDEGVVEDKGKKPHLTTKERVEQLSELPFIDKIIIYHQTTPTVLLTVKPDIFAHSPEWHSKNRDVVVDYMYTQGIKKVEIPYTTDISTSEIERRIYDTYTV